MLLIKICMTCQLKKRLREAIDHLKEDMSFLTEGGVFTEDMIGAYIDLAMEDVYRVEQTTHPVEFDMYYSL